jgi:hypothetical protein
MIEGLGAAWLIAGVLVLILIICWIVLPLAVLGIKPLIREQIALSKRTNALLEQLVAGPSASAAKAVAGWRAER